MSEQDGRAVGRIPEFTTIEEEGEFWDTHDFTDFLDESVPVEVRVSPNLTSVHRFTVEVDGAEWTALDRCASDRGMTPATLARLWLVERLRQEEVVGQASW